LPEPGFSDETARAGWNEGAAAWERFVESGADYYRREVHGPALLAACGPLDGVRVLDLGCGQGYFSRELARGGALVTGIDLSEAQVAHAREHEARDPLGIEYEVLSGSETGSRYLAGSFDLVTACMSLQDMADVPGALASAFALLRPGGGAVASVPPPFSDMPFREWERDAERRKIALRVDRYFESGPAVCHWNMPRLAYHWETPYWRFTLAEWSGMIEEAGFLIRRLREPRPTEEQVRRMPDLDDCGRLPYFLVLDLLKPS